MEEMIGADEVGGLLFATAFMNFLLCPPGRLNSMTICLP